MEDLLSLQYPSMVNRIKRARELGFSDEEIDKEISSRIERARAKGFSEFEINQGLGVTEQSRSLLQEAKRKNAMKFISEAYDLTIPRAQKALDNKIHPALLTDDEIARRVEEESKQIQVGPMHERPSVETLRTHSAFWRKVDDPAIGATNRALGGLVTGFMTATGGFSRSMEWLTGWEAARSFADRLENASSNLSSELLEGNDPNLWDAFWQGSGSLAFYLLPSMLVAKGVLGAAGGAYALGLSEAAAVGLARWLGATSQQVIEGFSEAGPVYKQVLDSTGDEGAASIAAAKTFWTNLPLGILTNRLGFFGDSEIARKVFSKVLPDRAVNLVADAVARAVPEMAQETGQGIISRHYGDRIPWTEMDLRQVFAQEGVPGFLVAAITGSTLEAGGERQRATVTEASKIKYRAQAAKVYNRVKEQLVSAGLSEQVAGANAALWAARAYTVGIQTGTDPEGWYEQQKLSVKKEGSPGGALDLGFGQGGAPANNEAFARWFEGSTVVTDSGEPLVVYHASPATEADGFEGGPEDRLGVHVTSSPELAQEFAGETGRVQGGYLSLKNPLEVASDLGDLTDVESWKEFLGPDGYEIATQEEVDGLETVDDVRDLLIRRGYDGIAYENDSGGIDYIAFDPDRFRPAENPAPSVMGTGSVYYQYAGQNARVIPEGLEEAEQMRRTGASNEEIRQKTGWFFGMDGDPRFEIDDSQARFKGLIVGEHKLSSVLDFPALFKAYPTLEDANIRLDPSLPNGTAEYYPATDTINIAPDSNGEAHQIGILLHEIQHAIQAREGFADGGNLRVALAAKWKTTRWGNYLVAQDALAQLKKAIADGADSVVLKDKDDNPVVVEGRDAMTRLEEQLSAELNKEAVYEVYRNIAGEIEAWDVFNRHGLDREGRRATPPDLRKNAIIVRNGKVIRYGASSEMPPIGLNEEGEVETNKQVGRVFWQSATKTSDAPQVDKLMRILDKADWHIFTAANPSGSVMTKENNARRNAELARQIESIAGRAEKNNRLAKAWDLVRETAHEAKYRNDLGYTRIVLVDPKQIREAWEAKHPGEKLVHSTERLEAVRGHKTFDGYPKISGALDDPNGISILDGRHRIAVAEERGTLIPVATDPELPIPDRFIKGTRKPKTRGKITVYEALGVFGGEPEPSFLVIGLKTSEAIDLAKKWGQAAITTPTGIYFVNDVLDADGVPVNYEGEFAPFTAGRPEIGLHLNDNYTEVDVDGVQVRFSYPADFENTFWVPKSAVAEGISAKVTAYLTPSERVKVRRRTAETVLKWLRQIPSPDEMASVAWAGRAKRGWYERSARAISEAFGQDAPRFAALLAALSPQCSVEDNLKNTLRVWTGWIRAGRPTDPQAIFDIMAQNVQGNKGDESVLQSWVNNSVRALTDAPEEMILSGPKVDSFRLNLLGNVIEVTNDTWMANYAGIEQKHLSGRLNKKRTDPGKGTAYLAMNILARRAAQVLSERTGQRWTPSEVQETVWSCARSLYYAATKPGKGKTPMPVVDFLKSGNLTAKDIANTPDFEVLFVTGVYEDILKEAGYGEEIARVRQLAEADGSSPGSYGGGGSPAWSPDSGIDREEYERHLQAAAERLSSETVTKNLEDQNQTFYQDESSPRGKLEVTETGERLVSLFQNADESTFLHETGHIFLLDFEQMATRDDAPEQVKKDWESLLNWLGAEKGKPLDTTHHEKFARGFEAWLMDGEAPTPRLARVFEWFRTWLTHIYHSVTQLDVTLSDEVRGVFDRMFAAEDEIESRTFHQEGVRPVNELPPDPQEKEETEAIMAMEPVARRAAEGDEEALFNPAWFKEGTPEGAAEVDDLMEAMESIAMKTEAWKGWQNLVKAVRTMGGISYDQVANLLGTDFATRLRESVGWLYRRTGLALDEMALRLSQMGYDVTDAQNLFDQLVNRPEPPVHLPPILAVNQENLPWLIERMGASQTRGYLKRRIKAIDATLKELRAEQESASNKGDEELAQLLKEEMWRLYSERNLAAETEEQLGKTPVEPGGDAEAGRVRWGEMAARAKNEAFKWVQANVKDTVLAVTGQTSVGELVTEKEALREAMRKAQRYSRIAARIARKTGYRAGYIEAMQRVAEVKRRQQARAAERAEVRSMVKDLDSATRGGISWEFREQIANLLEKFDTKRRGTTKAVRELAKADGISPRQYQAQIDAELRRFLADNPEAADDFTPDDLARISRQSVYEMSLDDLRTLHAQVMALREAGKADLKAKQMAYREKVDKTVDALVKSMGGKAAKSQQTMIPEKKKRGKFQTLKAWTWTPSRILDWLDQYGDFRGLWHTYMMRRTDAAEDAFLRQKFARHDATMKKMKELGITEGDLAAVRYSTVDPETGEKVDFTLDTILEVYVGWLNEKKRDALKYGNGIDESMKAEMEKLLKPNEIALAEAVLADYEKRRQALKKAMVDTYDVGFLDEPFYSPMYRDSWQESGELVDTGMEAVKNEFLRVNGLRRFYASHGFSHTRLNISPEHQTPLQLGLFGNWLKTVDIQEHFIAYASMVKEFQDVVRDPVLRQTLESRYGDEVYQALAHFVNRLAVPDFYKGYAAIDSMARFVRANAAVAYLAYNLGTILKQPTALAYYLRDAGATHLLLSACEFAFSPKKTLRTVWELDPQVKDQAIERTLEELKRTRDPKYKRARHAIGRAGFKPILWFDMVTRVIGWNAVYKAELAKGASPEDARYRAQRVTLNTQQAANPKELPRFMAQNEFLNLMTVFQNQANKVWNIASHDLWGDVKRGRITGALGTAMGLLTATFLLSLLTRGRPPEEPEELAGYLTEDIVGSLPIVGKGIVSAWHGFGGGTALDSAAQDLGKGLKGLTELKFGGDEILALYEAYALLLGGVPVTAVKRLLKTLDEGRPGAMLGWRKEKRKKEAMTYF